MPSIDAVPGRFRTVTKEEWERALRPDTPALPWFGSQGQQIRGVMIMPVPECTQAETMLFLDADGNPADVRDRGPMYHAAAALKPRLGEVLLLPDSNGPSACRDK